MECSNGMLLYIQGAYSPFVYLFSQIELTLDYSFRTYLRYTVTPITELKTTLTIPCTSLTNI